MDSEIEKANRRAFVKAMYPGPRWKRRVKNMPDDQIFAIWKREQDKPSPKRKESNEDEAPF